MDDSMCVEMNNDGSATATVGAVSRNFPDMQTAVEWATRQLYGEAADDGKR